MDSHFRRVCPVSCGWVPETAPRYLAESQDTSCRCVVNKVDEWVRLKEGHCQQSR